MREVRRREHDWDLAAEEEQVLVDCREDLVLGGRVDRTRVLGELADRSPRPGKTLDEERDALVAGAGTIISI